MRKKLCPVCGEKITITGRTTDGRVIGSCSDAFPARSNAERKLGGFPSE